MAVVLKLFQGGVFPVGVGMVPQQGYLYFVLESLCLMVAHDIPIVQNQVLLPFDKHW